MWITKIFFPSGFIIIPEERPLSPLWSSLMHNLWLKMIKAFTTFHDQFYSIYGLELLTCVVLSLFLVWKAEKHRFKDIDELIKLKRAQVIMEPNTWGIKKTRKNAEIQMQHAISILQNTHEHLDEMVAYLKKKKSCTACNKMAQEFLQQEKEREIKESANWLQNTYRKKYELNTSD